eukprot:CAMPEP_0183783128 /NCGR_PEP_ID=MMETSP0739-20130205/62799_1 /TAXON_ID=385413 /ORGANISM="Thalassiosira miniscula, Strain CCMP1093" /LENGTH=42 /DNA_ID= /DNA_START= /DNA_END= /DNA_ORIENTATION=
MVHLLEWKQFWLDSRPCSSMVIISPSPLYLFHEIQAKSDSAF